MAANTENDVFLSYSHQDEAFVEMLKDKLRERGFDAWQDRTDLQIGKEWDVQILRAIRRRRALAFVISPEALQSKYCLRELNHARRWGKVVVPILRRPIPDGWEAKITNAAQRKRAVTAWNWMRKIQYVDFLPDDDHNFEFSLNRLQLGLRVRERERSLGRLRILLAIGALLLVLLCVAISLLFDSNRDNENLADRVQRHQNQLETLYADQLDLQVTMQIANTSLMNASTALAIVNSDLNAELALEVLNDGNLASAREYAIASGEINPTSNAALTALRTVAPLVGVYTTHTHDVLAAAISPDGGYAVTGDISVDPANPDSPRFVIYDLTTKAIVCRRLRAGQGFTAAAFDSSGQFVFINMLNLGQSDGPPTSRLMVISIPDCTFPIADDGLLFEPAIFSLTVVPGTNQLLVGGLDTIALLQWDGEQLVRLREAKLDNLANTVAVNRTGDEALIGRADGKVERWNLTEWTRIGDPLTLRVDNPNAEVKRIVFHPVQTNEALATNQNGDICSLRLLPTKIEMVCSRVGEKPVVPLNALVYLPDGDSFLVGGYEDGTIFWLASDSFEVLGRFNGHNASVPVLAISPDGQQVLSTGSAQDTVVRVWMMAWLQDAPSLTTTQAVIQWMETHP